jgi:lipopolysaccharide/colanic/teichoic acid biosynthesis glycosyltransferase
MNFSLKRLFDVASSGMALLLLSPLLLTLALWVRLDTPGRVFFLQRRVGKDGELFRVYKFRTMIDRDPDLIDQRKEQVISEGVDPRITRAGRFLRRTSLDELPQLWNIFRGDMSVVGPRPVLPEQVPAIPPEFITRLGVRPGLTGLAQIRGRRSLGWLEQLGADVEYVCNRSFIYDMGIIVRTFLVVFSGQGVYGDASSNWRSFLPDKD